MSDRKIELNPNCGYTTVSVEVDRPEMDQLSEIEKAAVSEFLRWVAVYVEDAVVHREDLIAGGMTFDELFEGFRGKIKEIKAGSYSSAVHKGAVLRGTFR